MEFDYNYIGRHFDRLQIKFAFHFGIQFSEDVYICSLFKKNVFFVNSKIFAIQNHRVII